MGLEPTIPVFERAKTVHASDRAVSHCDTHITQSSFEKINSTDENRDVVSVGTQILTVLNVEHEIIEVLRSEIRGYAGKYILITVRLI
jgi:hypothetical protein